MQAAVCRSKTDYIEFMKHIAVPPKHDGTWYLPGFCNLCEKQTRFMVDSQDLRETLICEHCKLNSRKRFTAKFVKDRLESKGFKDVFLYEQVTDFWQVMKTYLNGKYSIITSEFLGYDRKSGEIVDGIRHENAMALSLKSESIDCIISNEVYEHVPDIHKALGEAYRVLRKGGEAWITTPVEPLLEKTEVRAIIENGRIKHLMEPEIHGNPMDPENGSLAFYTFSMDFLTFCKEAGFSDAYGIAYHSTENGHLGTELLQFVLVK